jgi:NAD(P)H-dependent FMN reductase
MLHISILSASVRRERKSHRVALYFKKYLEEHFISTTEILDLKEYNFPIFEDTLKTSQNPTEKLIEFANKIKNSDAIIIVTPEYNGGYPASLKNVIDVLYDEWHGRPISLCTVTSGALGGSQALLSLQFSLWKIGALTVTNMFCVSNVANTFDEKGNAIFSETTDKLAKPYIAELVENINKNNISNS